MRTRITSARSRVLIGLLATAIVISAVAVLIAASPSVGGGQPPSRLSGYPADPVVVQPPQDDGSDAAESVPTSDPVTAEQPAPTQPAKDLPPTDPSVVEVTLGAGVSAADVARLGGELGFTVKHDLWQIGMVAIESAGGEPIPQSTLDRLTADGLATEAEPSGRSFILSTPTDPRYAQQWGFNNTGQTGGTVGADANAEDAWDWARGDGIVVAVVDEGVMFEHPDLAGQQWVNSDEISGNGVDDDHNGFVDDTNGWDFLNDDATVWDQADGDLHGTHVAGTIAATANNGQGGVGAAWNARIMSLKFLGNDYGLDSAGAAAILYAVDNGADVINCSWGSFQLSSSINYAFQYAAEHNVLIACAAGNESLNADQEPLYPAAINTPNNISVAALDHNGVLAPFSNWGATTVDLGAPGVSILSTKARASAGVRVERRATGGTAPYSLLYYAFPIERLTDQATSTNLITTSVNNLATSKSSSILVVNDSWHTVVSGDSDYTNIYTAALAAAGYTNVTTWNTATQHVPTLTGYNTVIWFTGLMSYPMGTATLVTAEQTAVGDYLKAGGNLLLSSPQLADDLDYQPAGVSGQAWFQEYTQCRLANDLHQNTFAGISGGLFSGLAGSTPNWLAYPYSVGDEVKPSGTGVTPLIDWTAEYISYSGTSMATPHVAGAIALAWSRTPGATAAEIKQRLMSTATPTASLGGKSVTGGRLDMAAFAGTTQKPAFTFLSATGPTSASLSWVGFPDAYYASTRVLYRMGAAVAGPSDPAATVVSEAAASSATLNGLTEGATYHFAAYSRNTIGSWTEAATGTISLGTPPPTDPTLIDFGFEQGTDGAALASAAWTLSGSPQRREYDGSRAKVGVMSGWIQGPTTAAYAGVSTAGTVGMTANTAEIRFWAYLDTTNQNRVVTDGGNIEVRWDTADRVLIYTKGTATGYVTNAYTAVGTYATGWTEYRVVYNFTANTYALFSRTNATSAWTQLKAAGAPTYAVPMRDATDRTATGALLFRAYQNANLWLDDVRYANEGISEPVGPDTTAPSSPTALSATDTPADQGGSINLSWSAATDNVGVTGYKLFRGTSSGGYTTTFTLGNVTSYTDTTAATGTRYYYAVSAVDAAGNESVRSGESSAIALDNLAPAVPTGLAATGGTKQVSLTWSANEEPDLSGYDVYRNSAKVNTAPITSTTYTDTGLADATTYTYRLAAVDTHGNASAQSSQAIATTLPGTPPPADATLIDFGFEQGADGANLATPLWTLSGAPQRREYDSARAKVGVMSGWIQGPTTAAAAGVMTPAVMTSNGAEYRFWLYCDTTNQNRYVSDTGSVFEMRLNASGQVMVYTKRAATGYTANTYTAVGTYGPGWTEYRIVLDFTGDTYALSSRTVDGGTWTQLKASAAPTSAIPMREATDRTTTANLLFRAYQNTNLWLDEVRFADGGISEPVGPDTTAPSFPTALSAADTPADQGGSINLSWSAATDNVGVTGYKLHRGTASGVYTTTVTLGNVTSHTDATAATGTRYYYAVSAVDAAGNEGARSSESSAIALDNLAPAVPTGLAATGGTKQVSLVWNANTEADLSGYDLYRNGAKLNTVPITGTTYTDTGLADATTYTYRIAALDTHGNASAQSSQASATTLPGTPPPTDATLVDFGFENGADGAVLSSPAWTLSGTPQRSEYDSARAKVGVMSGWLQGPATAAYAGVSTAEPAGMTADTAEIRFWAYLDTANQNRVVTDGGNIEVRWDTAGRVLVYTKRAATGYTANAYTAVGTYATGWTEYRVVYNFSADTYALFSRTVADGAWTQLKAAGASAYAIPMRNATDCTTTGALLFRAYQNANLWLDDVRFANGGMQ